MNGPGGDLAVEAPMLEPADVGEGRELDVEESRPRSFRVDHLPLVAPVEALDEAVVVTVSFRADRSNDVVVGKALRVAQRQVLQPTVAVMDQPFKAVAAFPVVHRHC